ncbi:hypothetical protein SEA_BOBBY_61 [Mycobacterium phage Bobby]|nr:hypothetical protein SEA_BOBBY_61 [Mycobacterium phage Bobby]
MRFFFEGTEITEAEADWLEETGQAHIIRGASGGRPAGFGYRESDEGPWILLAPGPGNGWIEKHPGTCPDCKHPWNEHLRPVWVRPDPSHTCIRTPGRETSLKVEKLAKDHWRVSDGHKYWHAKNGDGWLVINHRGRVLDLKYPTAQMVVAAIRASGPIEKDS